jgi:hypothetical protein
MREAFSYPYLLVEMKTNHVFLYRSTTVKMGSKEESRRQGGCMKFLGEFRALFIKAFLLAVRKPGQTITEILLAYTFMGLLLGMRYILDRRYNAAFRLPRGRPQDYLNVNVTSDIIYYYPSSFRYDAASSRILVSR